MTLGKALRSILFSVVIISGLPWFSWGVYRFFWNARAYDSKYNIVAIVQTGPEKEVLKTTFLAELLNLSADRPTNLYQFDLSEGKLKLESFPLIQEASLKRISPGTLYVDYTVRRPVAFLGNVTNCCLDHEGRILPFKPFFSPKRLPELWVDLQEEKLTWGNKLSGPSALLSFAVLEEFERFPWRKELQLVRIDTSRAFSPSLGEQQLILIVEEQRENTDGSPLNLKHTLILNPETYQEGLQRYGVLRQVAVKGGDAIIDLRLPELGFITEGSK